MFADQPSIVFVIVCISSVRADDAHIYVPGLPNTNYYKHGDLDIGYLLSFTSPSLSSLCGNTIESWTYPFMEAVR